MSGFSRSPRTLAALSALAALSSLLSGCSSSGESASGLAGAETNRSSGPKATETAASPQQPTSPPEIGQCRNLAFSDLSLFSNQAKAVPCENGHTAYTFAVERLPDTIAFEGVSIQNKAVQSEAAQSCSTAYPAFVGGNAPTRALARLTVTYFLPRQRDFDLGARWVRCDAVALKTAQSLAPLPNDLKGLLDDETALAKLGLCSNGDPGAAGSTLVMCTQPHTFRALAALRLGDDDAPYPGVDATEARGQRCEDVVRGELGVDGGFTFGWTFPSAADWATGQRFGYCWNKTSK